MFIFIALHIADQAYFLS